MFWNDDIKLFSVKMEFYVGVWKVIVKFSNVNIELCKNLLKNQTTKIISFCNQNWNIPLQYSSNIK